MEWTALRVRVLAKQIISKNRMLYIVSFIDSAAVKQSYALWREDRPTLPLESELQQKQNKKPRAVQGNIWEPCSKVLASYDSHSVNLKETQQ
jgi:hypothetical protein